MYRIMGKLHKATLLLPEGKQNRVLVWMLKELAYSEGFGDLPLTCTELSERAADAFGRDTWLDDSEHWIWDAACIAFEEYGILE